MTRNTIEFNEKNRKIIRFTIIKFITEELVKELSNKTLTGVFNRITADAAILTTEIERALLANAEIDQIRTSVDEADEREALDALAKTRPEDIEFETDVDVDVDVEGEGIDRELEANLELMLNGQLVDRKSLRKTLTSGKKKSGMRSKSQKRRITSLIKSKRK